MIMIKSRIKLINVNHGKEKMDLSALIVIKCEAQKKMLYTLPPKQKIEPKNNTKK